MRADCAEESSIEESCPVVGGAGLVELYPFGAPKWIQSLLQSGLMREVGASSERKGFSDEDSCEDDACTGV